MVLFTLLVAGSVWPNVLLWRDRSIRGVPLADVMEMGSLALPIGTQTRRGLVRAGPVMCAGMGLLTVALWVFEFVSGVDNFLVLISLSLPVLALCAISIVVFNRPRMLVPPHLREDLGAWAVKRQGR
ncbi:hypothetical protein [Streptomyces sp. NPDC049881]|uniref:hypothetical protein n=1 Tax=Streptomyces sp. NPDC049881 TaxID=3155778 RepID=UPI003427F446